MMRGLWWRDRAGCKQSVALEVSEPPTEAELAGLRLHAMLHGWPGHNGGRWNYLRSDVAKVLAAIGGKHERAD